MSRKENWIKTFLNWGNRTKKRKKIWRAVNEMFSFVAKSARRRLCMNCMYSAPKKYTNSHSFMLNMDLVINIWVFLFLFKHFSTDIS